jgi:sporulation-control protein
MVLKKMLRAFAGGGLTVDTVLAHSTTRPGEMVTGTVNLATGDAPVAVESIALGLVARVEVDGRSDQVVEFHRLEVSGGRRFEADQQVSLPFQLPVPWEAPITSVYGQPVRGMAMGVRTEVAVARAVDKGDLDPLFVEPLPIQERILAAFTNVGFRFSHADLEAGRIRGIDQRLPFYQEFEFWPAQQYAHSVSQVEVTFVANPQGVQVVLEFDRRGFGGQDPVARYEVPHADAGRTDWDSIVDGWVAEAVSRHQALGRPGFGGKGHGHGGHRGSGVGGMVAAGAAGVLGGMMLGDMMDGGLIDGDFGGEGFE